MPIEKTTEAMQQRLKEMDKIFNLAPDIIGLANLEGYFTKINLPFMQLLDYTKKELPGIKTG